MKIFNITWTVLFILFAAVQYNDPDPYVWMPIYLYGAFMCWKASKLQFYPSGYVVGILVYAGYAVYKMFDENGLIDWIRFHHAENIAETMKAEKPWIEETREFFGLVILIGVLLMNWFYAKKKMKQAAGNTK
ncbi:MAG: transmembrane 220 family protein [Bacteroidetes bacterium]|nr:transmembrane 220 family protein [Bacteroidota bacterium]